MRARERERKNERIVFINGELSIEERGGVGESLLVTRVKLALEKSVCSTLLLSRYARSFIILFFLHTRNNININRMPVHCVSEVFNTLYMIFFDFAIYFINKFGWSIDNLLAH